MVVMSFTGDQLMMTLTGAAHMNNFLLNDQNKIIMYEKEKEMNSFR